MDWYLAELIGDMTKYLADHNLSHPAEMTDEDWKTTLQTISKCFKQYNEEKPCPAYEKYHNAVTRIEHGKGCIEVSAPEHLLEVWRKEDEANAKATMDELKQGFDLLYSIYPTLWD